MEISWKNWQLIKTCRIIGSEPWKGVQNQVKNIPGREQSVQSLGGKKGSGAKGGLEWLQRRVRQGGWGERGWGLGQKPGRGDLIGHGGSWRLIRNFRPQPKGKGKPMKGLRGGRAWWYLHLRGLLWLHMENAIEQWVMITAGNPAGSGVGHVRTRGGLDPRSSNASREKQMDLRFT